MCALKLTVLLFTLPSVCLCDDGQQETRTILNQVPVYNHDNNLVPDQEQDYKSNIGSGYNNNYENVYKQYYAGNSGAEYANGYGNEYNTAENTKANYGQLGNGYTSGYAPQLYGKDYGNEFTSNSRLASGSGSAYGYGGSDIIANTKQVVAQIPSGNNYGYNYGEAVKTNGALGESISNEVKGKFVQGSFGSFNGYNYGESGTIKSPPTQVPGQDYHEYSYEEALKASGALDASGNIVANTKPSAAQIPTANQYGYNYAEFVKANDASDQHGNIAQVQPVSYYGYNYGDNVQTTSSAYKVPHQNLYASQLAAALPTNPTSEVTNSIGHLYSNIANVAFNKQPEDQVPQQNYYAGRIGKQLNLNDQIANAYLSGYGYGNSNIEFVSKPIPGDVYQADTANKYIGAAEADLAKTFAFNSASHDYKNKLATALVYHTNSDGSFGQKASATGVNNAFVTGYEKLNSFPLSASVPVQVSKPHNYEYKSVQSSIPNVNQFTQSLLQSYAQNYPASNIQSATAQIPQIYITGSKSYPVRVQNSASEAQTISGLDSHAYIDSALQFLPVATPQTNIHSTYVKEHKAVQGLEGETHQEPKIVSVGPYQYTAQPQEVYINQRPDTVTKNGYESYGYNHAELDTGAYKTGYAKEVTAAFNRGLNEVKSSAAGYTGFSPSEYGSTGTVSNAYQSQHGAYNTINYNQYDFNGHNATNDASNVYGYNGYDNEQALKAAEQFVAGFEANNNYKANAINQQPSRYSSNNYVSGGYVVGDTNGYQPGDHTSSNIQTGEYEPSTYKTITNASNDFDLGYESGYETDSYGSNGFKPIELTTSGYASGNHDASGYKFNTQDSQAYAAYNRLPHDHKTNVREVGDSKSAQFKPFSYSAAQTEAAKILTSENESGQSATAHATVKDHVNAEEKAKSTGKSNKTKKGKSGSSSAYVSVTHGNHSYSYNVKQQNDK